MGQKKQTDVRELAELARRLLKQMGEQGGSPFPEGDLKRLFTECGRRLAELPDREALASFSSENPNPILRIDEHGILQYANDFSSFLLKAWGVGQGEAVPMEIREAAALAKSTDSVQQKDFAVSDRTYTLQFTLVPGTNDVNIYGQDITTRKQAEDDLRVNRERLEMALSAAELGLWDWNMATDDVIVDRNFAAMLGYDLDELSADFDWQGLFHPDDKDSVLREIRHASEDKTLFKAEFRLKTKSHGWQWFSSVGEVVERDGAGAPRRMLGIQTGISDRKEREEGLNKVLSIQAALSRLYEHLVSPDATIATVSEALYEEALALTGAEYALCATIDRATGGLTPYTFDQLVPGECTIKGHGEIHLIPDKNGVYPALWGHALNTGKPFFTNEPNRHKSSHGLPEGHVPIQQFLAVPIVLGKEKAGLIALANKKNGFDKNDLACIQDMARYYGLAIQGIEAREKLSENEEQYRTLVETMQEGIFMLDRDTCFTYVNHQLCKMLGKSRSEIISRNCVDFIAQAERDFFLEQMEARKAGGSEKYEITFMNAEGDKVFTLVSPTPLFNDSGEFTGSFGVVTNITQLKVLESQLLQAQKLESIGQLAAGIAHEINTPVQYVDNNVRYLQEGVADLLELATLCHRLDEAGGQAGEGDMVAELRSFFASKDFSILEEEIPDAINDSLEGLNRISTIVQSVKQLAHPGKTDMEFFNINEAVRSTVTVSTNEWKYVADMSLDLEETIPLIPGYKAELNQVILNLIINSAHAIKEKLGNNPATKGSIAISTRLVGDMVRLQVADTGNGIPEAIRSKVFDPFFTTKEVGKGTGQGLAISFGVIRDKHNGEITFESEEGKGTTFTITLPVDDAAGKTESES